MLRGTTADALRCDRGGFIVGAASFESFDHCVILFSIVESYHDRRLARQLKEDSEFQAEFERQRASMTPKSTISPVLTLSLFSPTLAAWRS